MPSDGERTARRLERAEPSPALPPPVAANAAAEPFRNLLALSPDAIFIHVDDIIVAVNDATVRLLRARSSDDIVGRRASSLIAVADHGRLAAARRQVSDDGRTGSFVELRLHRLDGSILEGETFGVAAVWDGRQATVVTVRDISERKSTEARLRESEALYRIVTDNVPAAIIAIDRSLRVKLANRTLGEWYATAAAALAGRHIGDFVPGDVLASFRPAIAAALAGETTRVEQKVLYPDGQERWVDFLRVPDRSDDGSVRGYVTLAVDITERKKADEALRENEARLRKVFERSPDGIYVHVEGCIVFANPAAARLFGYDRPESLVGTETLTYFPAEHHEYIKAQREAILREGLRAPSMVHALRRCDGGELQVEATATEIVWQGRRAILVYIRDVTERERYENELLAAKNRAELANHAKSAFLANMSHELRTPLNAIIGFAEILKDERFDSARLVRRYADDIHQSGLHLLTIINDILDMAKIEAGRMALAEELFDLGDEIDAALRMIAARAADGGLDLVRDVAPDLAPILADRRMIKQILLNLLSNAVKFTPSGGSVTIRARTSDGGGIAIAIADNGIGIAERDQAQVMQPFGQAESGLSRRFEGTGLGLSISKAMAELHGGGIAIASAVGHGTTITVTLPPQRVRPQPV